MEKFFKPQLFRSLKTYSKKDVLGDLLAGLMVAIIALPLSMALGIQSVPDSVSQNGLQMGIITAIIAGFFISFLGGSKFQIGGPTAAFVAILAGYLLNPQIGILGVAICGIMAGVLLILMGLLKCGKVMKFFPYPITIGFTTGIGITLIIGQIKDLCGFTGSVGAETIEKVTFYAKNIATFHLPTFIVGLVGFLIVFFLPKINKKIPAAFVALICCTLITMLFNGVFHLEVATIQTRYGDIKAEFYPLNLSTIGSINFGALVVPTITIAFLCAIESLLSATVAGGMTGTTFDSNQELIGQGVANIFSSALGGLPATGAIARTAAGIENGAKSPLTGVFHAVFLLIMYFLLMDVVKFIPMAVFASILVGVAINMSRFPLFIKLTKFGIRDVIVLILTCVLTIIFDLTYGVIGGILVAILLNVKNFKLGLKIDINDNVVRAKGSMFFANVNKLTELVAKLQGEKIVLDLENILSIDQTALEKIIKLSKQFSAEQRVLEIANANPKTKQRIEKYFSVI